MKSVLDVLAIGYPRMVTILVIALVSASPLRGDDVDVIDAQGEKISGQIRAWSNDRIVISAGTGRDLSVWSLRSISFRRPVGALSAGSSLIRLMNGDRLNARPVSVAEDLLAISWPLFPSIKLPSIPLEKATALIFELPTTPEDRCRLFADLDTFPPGSDLVMLLNGDRTTGEFQKLDAAFVEVKSGTNVLKLDRSKVRSIRLNPELATVMRPPVRRTLIRLLDGSLLTATDVSFAEGRLNIKSAVLGNLSLPLTAISSCDFHSEQIEPLSDREPADYKFVPFLSSKWPYRRNANVLHGPLMLRGTEYPTGIGVHSRSSISYTLHGNERFFTAVIGIDDITQGSGSAVFAVELDGRNVWTSPEVTGKSPLLTLPEIDLRGSKTLTLVVDFGQFADVGDYANWCDALLICDPVQK